MPTATQDLDLQERLDRACIEHVVTQRAAGATMEAIAQDLDLYYQRVYDYLRTPYARQLMMDRDLVLIETDSRVIPEAHVVWRTLEERIEEAVLSRAAGRSLQTIADELGVTNNTVRNDLHSPHARRFMLREGLQLIETGTIVIQQTD